MHPGKPQQHPPPRPWDTGKAISAGIDQAIPHSIEPSTKVPSEASQIFGAPNRSVAQPVNEIRTRRQEIPSTDPLHCGHGRIELSAHPVQGDVHDRGVIRSAKQPSIEHQSQLDQGWVQVISP